MSSIEDEFVETALDIDTDTSEDITKDSFACEICDTNMNQTDFVQHVIEKHFKVSYFKYILLKEEG